MEILNMITSMAPFLLLGFFLAGVMHVFVPSSLYRQHLSQPTFKSVLYATLIGIPIPLCSCGVIPTAMSLRKEGASRGSVISFLIATPQTGVDSILATYSMMGLPFAIVRPIAALVTALFGGALSNVVDRSRKDRTEIEEKTINVAEEEAPKGFWNKVKAVFVYAYYTMMQDIGKWLVVGLVIAGLITAYLPDSFLAAFSDNTLLSILLVLVCAIPMYVCATGSIPIAIALMMKGLSPGAALVLLMAGPAVNVASMIVINKVMGWRSLVVYLISIILGATVFALGIDYLFPRELFLGNLSASCAACGTEGISLFKWICAGALLLMLLNALIRRFFVSKKLSTAETQSGQLIHISGMQCNHCLANAQKAITAVDGVESVNIDLASGNAVIFGKFDMDKVVADVEALGFKVEVKGSGALSPVSRIHIGGMQCNHCLANAQKAISAVPGVESVNIDLPSGNASIQGNFDMNQVVTDVEALGFKVQIIETNTMKTKTTNIHISGMQCNHCLANAKKAILAVKGVESVEIDLASGNASVVGEFEMAQLVKDVEALGFKVSSK